MRIFALPILALLLANCSNTSSKVALADARADNNLVWADEFSSNQINSEYWNIVEGNGCPELCGFGNNEAQFYTANSIEIINGVLNLHAKQAQGNTAFTAAKITTKNKIDWKSGYLEVRAKLPQGKGTWPAIWLLPTTQQMSWPLDGEIDVMEHVGYNPGWVYGTIHTKAYNHIKGTQKSDSILVSNFNTDFNNYGLLWTDSTLEWYVNEQLYNKIDRASTDKKPEWPFTNDFHLILNFAVGGNWGGRYGIDSTAFPQSFQIDYVRLFKNKPFNSKQTTQHG